MSIVSSADILAYTGEAVYTSNLPAVHEGVEAMVKKACGKTFESATYFELYDGKGQYYRLRLDNEPITAVSRVSVDLDAVMKIKNINTDATTASVKVDATNVTLAVNGGAGHSTTTLAIATYDTLTKLVDAINALDASYGWSAELYDSDYTAKKTALLIPQQIDVTSWVSVSDYINLYMGVPTSFIVVDRKYIEAYFPRGTQNIAVSYTAGESSADIELLILMLVKYMNDRKTASADGVKRWQVGEIMTEYYVALDEMPFLTEFITANRKVVI